jgi:hypothetical protein
MAARGERDRSRAFDTCAGEEIARILALVFDTPIDPKKAGP